MGEFIAPVAMGLGLFIMIGWIVYVVVDGRRRAEQIKAATDFQTRILDRMGSAKDFGDFVASDAGQKFLDSLASPVSSPKLGLLRAVQSGIVLLAVGVTGVLLGSAYDEMSPGMTAIGALVAACGLGFLVSTFVSYRMSKALGLLDGDGSARR